MVQVPSEDVTTVRPFAVEVDMLVDPLPTVEFVVTEESTPPVRVDPETAPPPAETVELVSPAREDAEEEFGGFSPGLS